MSDGVLSPLDDLPVHQTSEPVRFVGTSDRNFYDRYYFNLHDGRGEIFVTAGLGQYPNLSVADAFVAVTVAGHQHVLRSSRRMSGDRMDTTVGPISVEVIEGLRRLHLTADPQSETGIGLDAVWTPAVPAFLEARHRNRKGPRIVTETSRFFQTGFWEGTLRIDGRELPLTPGEWWGGRDRSWGIRPVGEPEARGVVDGPGGFLWIYCTMQFPDFSVLAILQEDQHGRRSLEQAVRVWPEGSRRDPEDLGHVDHDLVFAGEGSRSVEHATLTFASPEHGTVIVSAHPLAASYLSLGTGYGMEADWRHGVYQGDLVVQERSYDLGDEQVRKHSYGLVDNLARFEMDGAVGYGLFENAVLGPNTRYGLGARP